MLTGRLFHEITGATYRRGDRRCLTFDFATPDGELSLSLWIAPDADMAKIESDLVRSIVGTKDEVVTVKPGDLTVDLAGSDE